MVYLDIERVRWLIGQVTAAANAINETRDPATAPRFIPGSPSGADPDPDPVGTVPATAFGNTAGASPCHTAWQDVATGVGDVLGYLRMSLEADVGRLDTVLRAFQETDAESADELCAAGLRSNALHVFNTHLDAHSAERRADQADAAVDEIEPQLAPTIFAGDYNTETPPEVDRLEDRGWTDASTAYGRDVPTFGDRAIDRVYTSPGIVATGPAESIEGHPSDHDPLRVDLAVAPAWP